MQVSNTRTAWAIALGAAVAALVLVIATVVVLSSRHVEDPKDVEPASTATTSSRNVASTDPEADGTVEDDRHSRAVEPDRSGEPELVDRTIQFGIVQREYTVMTPSWMLDNMSLPVVVALHGMAVGRREMIEAANWREAVQQRGFIAVFPQGFTNSWNSGSCCPPASLVGIDDVGFLDSVLAAVEESEPVDPDRVFMTGFSNGGIMTYRYACVRSERIVAIAPMAGSNVEGCSPEVPVSLMHQHADPDPVVPYGGGFGVGQLLSAATLPSVPDSVDSWAAASGCGHSSVPSELTAVVAVTTWEGCPRGTTVELVRIAGIGHSWPRIDDYDGFIAMLDFFGLN